VPSSPYCFAGWPPGKPRTLQPLILNLLVTLNLLRTSGYSECCPTTGRQKARFLSSPLPPNRGINYADQVMGNFFPEAIVPTIFHKDPRYFRKGEGSKKGRLWYAVSHIVVSKNDQGVNNFNSPEILGNALASLADLSYHVHERNAKTALYTWGVTYIGSDTVGQIMKEFWPDIKRKLFQRHNSIALAQ
jgi:hypothetical protein